MSSVAKTGEEECASQCAQCRRGNDRRVSMTVLILLVTSVGNDPVIGRTLFVVTVWHC